MRSSQEPFVDGVRGLDALRAVLFWGQALRVLVGTTGCRTPYWTSDAAHSCKNLEGKVRIEAAKGDTLRQ